MSQTKDRQAIYEMILIDTGDPDLAKAVADVYQKATMPSSLLERFRAFLMGETSPLPQQGFRLLDDENKTFVAWYSNTYQDMEREFLARAGFENDIAFMDATGEYPDLIFFHLDSAILGKAYGVFLIGNFVVAVGEIDTPLGLALYDKIKGEQWEMSHGFFYDPETFDGETYHDFHTFEISILPPGTAANPLTAFDLPYRAIEEDTDMSKSRVNPKAVARLRQLLEGTAITVEEVLATGLAATEEADLRGLASRQRTAALPTRRKPEMPMAADGEEMLSVEILLERIVALEEAVQSILAALPTEPIAEEEEALPAEDENPASVSEETLRALGETITAQLGKSLIDYLDNRLAQVGILPNQQRGGLHRGADLREAFDDYQGQGASEEQVLSPLEQTSRAIAQRLRHDS
jgi:hypothetical protein